MAENSSSGNGKKITVAKTPSSLIVDEDTAQKRVAEFEEMFTDRYTEKDEDYVATTASPVPPPPCVRNFFTRQKRNFYDRSRQGYRGRGGYQGDRGRRDRGGRSHPYGDRHHDNRSEHGSRYHPYQDRNRQYHDNRNRHGDRY